MIDKEKLIEATGILRQWREHIDAEVEDAIETVLAVFEKAHTPTDDFPHGHPEIDPTNNEREALHLIEQAASFREQVTDSASPGSLVDLWLRTAAALETRVHRTEVPEPSAGTEDEMHARGATSFDCDRCGQDPEDCYCGDEPQGEPSDAQAYDPDGKTIEATIDWVKRNYAYRPGEDDEYVGQIIDALEAAHDALRAAGGVR